VRGGTLEGKASPLGWKRMWDRYLVLTASKESAQKIHAQLNEQAEKGYRLVGIIPPRAGISPDALLVLELKVE